MPIKRPERKVALLIGVEDYGIAGYPTLTRVKSDLDTLEAKLTGDGFVIHAARGKDAANRETLKEALRKAAQELLHPQQPAEGVGADSAHSSTAVSQGGPPDPSSTFTVVYYSGHGTVDASTGESCMVAGDGSVVPIPVVQQLFQDVGWLVMLYDACRNVSVGQQEAAAGANEQQQRQQQQAQQQQQQEQDEPQQPPPPQQQQQQTQQQQEQNQQVSLNQDFSIKHRNDQHNLIAYSCKYAATARDGLFTDELLKAWSPTKSVFHTITDATSALENTRGQWSTVDMSGAASKSFVLFSFHQNLLQGKLNASPVVLQGRDSEKRTVRSALLQDRLCVIEGGPGEGKSALAETVGQLTFNAGKFPGGAYKVDFRGVSGGVRASFAQQLANLLCDEGCIPALTGQDPWEAIQGWLRHPFWKDQPALILIDNADEVLGHEDGLTELQQLLQNIRQLSETAAVMITSRCANLLALQQQPIVLQPLHKDAAVKLLKERCTRSLEQEPAEALLELCSQVCRCNPLMLLFVAAAISDGGVCANVQEMLDLSHPGGALEGVWHDDPYMSKEYVDSLNRWWEVMLRRFLTQGELQGLARLAIFPANFSLDAAEFVAGGSIELSRQMLANLRSRRVLHSVEDLEGYYTMHPVHREVAFTMLNKQPEDIALAQNGFVVYVLSLKERLSAAQPTSALQLIQAETVNMLAALKMPGLNDRPPSAIVASGLPLSRLGAFVSEQCQYPLAKQLLQHALVMAEVAHSIGDPTKRQMILCIIQVDLADVLEQQGDLAQAEVLARSALEAANSALTQVQEDRGNDAASGEHAADLVRHAGSTLAGLYLTRGKLEAAKDLFSSLIESTPENNDAMAKLHNDLGLVYLELGLLEDAEQWLRSALNISRIEQPAAYTAEFLANAAQVIARRFARTGQRMLLAEAVDMANTACHIFATTRGAHHASFATSLRALADIFFWVGLVERAEQLYREALAVDENIYGPFSTPVADSLECIALCVETKAGGLVEAEGLLEHSLDIRQHILGSYHQRVAGSQQNLAHNLALQGTPDKLERAEALAMQALQTMRAVFGARSPNVVSCLKTLYFLLKKRAKYHAAMRVWLEVQVLAHPWGCLAASAAVAAACGGFGWLLCRKCLPAISYAAG